VGVLQQPNGVGVLQQPNGVGVLQQPNSVGVLQQPNGVGGCQSNQVLNFGLSIIHESTIYSPIFTCVLGKGWMGAGV
jgi:hypothetical protein